MHPRKDAGFTLIDSLVATSIFGLVASAVSGLLVFSFATVNANTNETEAIVLAKEEVEDLRSLPYGAIDSQQRIEVRRGKTFRIDSTVAIDQPGANMKEITVTISWDDHGDARQYAVGTLFTQVQR